jgi:hypothetical protein
MTRECFPIISACGIEVTEIRHCDGYFNATKLCQAGGKTFSNYFQNKQTRAFVSELVASYPPCTQLVQRHCSGSNDQRCTWVHPRIATHMAMWISPGFAADVTSWVELAKQKLPQVADEYHCSISKVTNSFFANRMEASVRDKLCASIPTARIEVAGVHGPIDIVSDHEVIEVKHVSKYTHAVGQVLGHAQSFPAKGMRIHLFGTKDEVLEKQQKAEDLCEGLGVRVTVEILMHDVCGP